MKTLRCPVCNTPLDEYEMEFGDLCLDCLESMDREIEPIDEALDALFSNMRDYE